MMIFLGFAVSTTLEGVEAFLINTGQAQGIYHICSLTATHISCITEEGKPTPAYNSHPVHLKLGVLAFRILAFRDSKARQARVIEALAPALALALALALTLERSSAAKPSSIIPCNQIERKEREKRKEKELTFEIIECQHLLSDFGSSISHRFSPLGMKNTGYPVYHC